MHKLSQDNCLHMRYITAHRLVGTTHQFYVRQCTIPASTVVVLLLSTAYCILTSLSCSMLIISKLYVDMFKIDIYFDVFTYFVTVCWGV